MLPVFCFFFFVREGFKCCHVALLELFTRVYGWSSDVQATCSLKLFPSLDITSILTYFLVFLCLLSA